VPRWSAPPRCRAPSPPPRPPPSRAARARAGRAPAAALGSAPAARARCKTEIGKRPFPWSGPFAAAACAAGQPCMLPRARLPPPAGGAPPCPGAPRPLAPLSTAALQIAGEGSARYMYLAGLFGVRRPAERGLGQCAPSWPGCIAGGRARPGAASGAARGQPRSARRRRAPAAALPRAGGPRPIGAGRAGGERALLALRGRLEWGGSSPEEAEPGGRAAGTGVGLGFSLGSRLGWAPTRRARQAERRRSSGARRAPGARWQ
jgi:hypothetical protein